MTESAAFAADPPPGEGGHESPHQLPAMSDLLARLRDHQAATAALLNEVESCLARQQLSPAPLADSVAATRAADSVPALTVRELAVLRLVGDGATNRTIARRLDISEKTVKNHLGSVFSKLGVHSRAQAVLAASHLQLLQEVPQQRCDPNGERASRPRPTVIDLVRARAANPAHSVVGVTSDD